MYLSTVRQEIEGDRYVLAVVLDEQVFQNMRLIGEKMEQFPYTALGFKFPVDNVRLIEPSYIDGLYEDMEPGEISNGEDHLSYYGYELHNYKPLEDFWYATKPESAMLDFYSSNMFGFSVRYRGHYLDGLGVDFSRLLRLQ